MNKADRTPYRQLANDAVIATFGESGLTAQLAEALEKCVDELDDANEKCPTCSVCENHGDLEDESIDVDADEIFSIHGELKKQVQALKDYHVKLSGELADWADPAQLTEPLAEIIEEIESEIDDLEVQVTI